MYWDLPILSPQILEWNSLGTWGSRRAHAEGGSDPCASHSKPGTPGPKRLTCPHTYRLRPARKGKAGPSEGIICSFNAQWCG